MAMDADETLVDFVSGGCVANTAPMMNIMVAIHSAPAISDFLRPTKSIPMMRKMAVVTTFTVPYTPVANSDDELFDTPTVWKICGA
jgi:hypothetical protein